MTISPLRIFTLVFTHLLIHNIFPYILTHHSSLLPFHTSPHGPMSAHPPHPSSSCTSLSPHWLRGAGPGMNEPGLGPSSPPLTPIPTPFPWPITLSCPFLPACTVWHRRGKKARRREEAASHERDRLNPKRLLFGRFFSFSRGSSLYDRFGILHFHAVLYIIIIIIVRVIDDDSGLNISDHLYILGGRYCRQSVTLLLSLSCSAASSSSSPLPSP